MKKRINWLVVLTILGAAGLEALLFLLLRGIK